MGRYLRALARDKGGWRNAWRPRLSLGGFRMSGGLKCRLVRGVLRGTSCEGRVPIC